MDSELLSSYLVPETNNGSATESGEGVQSVNPNLEGVTSPTASVHSVSARKLLSAGDKVGIVSQIHSKYLPHLYYIYIYIYIYRSHLILGSSG